MRFVLAWLVFVTAPASAQTLPSWNEGEAKAAIVKFVQAVIEARAQNWIVVSMKSDWQRIFAFDK